MLANTLSSFALIFLAEFGDKSQLACMLLASRHRTMPVFLGASTAFLLLNILAVLLGSAAIQLIPQAVLAMAAALMFIVFSAKALFGRIDEEQSVTEKSSHSIFVTAFILIFIAELGDKTQLSVAALSVTLAPFAVYIGATLALLITTALGVVGGRWLLKFVPLMILHRVSGVGFLGFALWILYANFL